MENNLSDYLDSMSDRQDKDKVEQAIALLSSISAGGQTSSSSNCVEGNVLKVIK